MLYFLFLLLLAVAILALLAPFFQQSPGPHLKQNREDPFFFKIFQLKVLAQDHAAGKLSDEEYSLIQKSLEEEALQLLEDRKREESELEKRKQAILAKEWLCTHCYTFHPQSLMQCPCGQKKP